MTCSGFLQFATSALQCNFKPQQSVNGETQTLLTWRLFLVVCFSYFRIASVYSESIRSRLVWLCVSYKQLHHTCSGWNISFWPELHCVASIQRTFTVLSKSTTVINFPTKKTTNCNLGFIMTNCTCQFLSCNNTLWHSCTNAKFAGRTQLNSSQWLKSWSHFTPGRSYWRVKYPYCRTN